MGKKIIWSPTSLQQLEEIHQNIFSVSQSIDIADNVINDILNSVDILKLQPEIYTLDNNKLNNDGSYRSFEVRNYRISYRILTDVVRVIRVRYSRKEARKY